MAPRVFACLAPNQILTLHRTLSRSILKLDKYAILKDPQHLTLCSPRFLLEKNNTSSGDSPDPCEVSVSISRCTNFPWERNEMAARSKQSADASLFVSKTNSQHVLKMSISVVSLTSLTIPSPPNWWGNPPRLVSALTKYQNDQNRRPGPMPEDSTR